MLSKSTCNTCQIDLLIDSSFKEIKNYSPILLYFLYNIKKQSFYLYKKTKLPAD